MGRPRTGSVRKEGDHFVARILLDGKYERIHLPTGLSEERAREMAQFYTANPDKARERLAEQGRGRRCGTVEPKGETFNEYLERWLEDRDRRGLSGIQRDRGAILNRVSPHIGTKPIAVITRRDLEAVVESLDRDVLEGKIQWATAVRVWGSTRKLFRDAARSKVKALRVRDDNPAAEVAPPDKGIEKAMVYIYPDEFLRLVECEKIPLEWRRIFALATYLYLRFSEIDRLRWSDLDLDRSIAYIQRGFDDYRKIEKTPKGGKTRKFHIEPNLLPLLRVMRAEAGSEGYVCHDQLSRPAARFRECLLQAGITRPELFKSDATHKRITFHDLRATGCTWMALRGDQPLVIQQRAGHRHFSTTQRYIREAESISGNVGQPFPQLPAALLRFRENLAGNLAESTQPSEIIHPARPRQGDAVEPSEPDWGAIGSETGRGSEPTGAHRYAISSRLTRCALLGALNLWSEQ
ncbi:tyrosine-type recombinase/integrase [Polyangium aurulentum]|uniref:tyrosine-type recombinase/integrase n=1 Tax=Polyangium aurulentum TaxID=2567896 RepID=UPI0010AE02AD|nr:tyrosine-type recombinase/integrase [Polyangium aurulentum]UQA61784.1 site-specific integrase [Polyangium aurulentum]